MVAWAGTRNQCSRGGNRGSSWLAAILTLAALGCGESLAPSAYASIRIEPREILVALGTTRPIAIQIRGVRANGTSDTLSRADVALSIADTSYAVFEADSITGRLFGGTYLRAELRRGTRRGPRDSIPVIVFRVG